MPMDRLGESARGRERLRGWGQVCCVKGSRGEQLSSISIYASSLLCKNFLRLLILNCDALKVRRQYLFVDGRTVLAFVTNGEKFAQCPNYTDITADVKCKVNCCQRKQKGGK